MAEESRNIREIYLLVSPYMSFLLSSSGKLTYHARLLNSITTVSKSEGVYGFIVLDGLVFSSIKEQERSLVEHAGKMFGHNNLKIVRQDELSPRFFYDESLAKRLVERENVTVTGRGTYTLRGVLQSVSYFIKAYNIPSQNAFVNLRESIDGGRPEINAKMISGLPELIQIEKKTPQICLNDLVRWRDKRIHILKKMGFSFG